MNKVLAVSESYNVQGIEYFCFFRETRFRFHYDVSPSSIARVRRTIDKHKIFSYGEMDNIGVWVNHHMVRGAQ